VLSYSLFPLDYDADDDAEGADGADDASGGDSGGGGDGSWRAFHSWSWAASLAPALPAPLGSPVRVRPCRSYASSCSR